MLCIIISEQMHAISVMELYVCNLQRPRNSLALNSEFFTANHSKSPLTNRDER